MSGVEYPWFNCLSISRTTHPALESAAHKVRWAEIHLESLQRRTFDQMVSAGQPVLQADLDQESGYHVFRIVSMPDYSAIRADASLGIGDVAGNLRAALDHAIWGIVQPRAARKRGFNEKDIAFPIGTSASLLTSKAAKAIRPHLNSGEWAVVETAQLDRDYPGGLGVYEHWGTWQSGHDHPLRLLRDMSNGDKHRLLQTILLLPTFLSFQEYNAPAQRLERLYMSEEIVSVPDTYTAPWGTEAALGTEVYRTRFAGAVDAHIDSAGQVSPQLALPAASIGAIPAVGTLDRIACFVKFLLLEFEKAQLG